MRVILSVLAENDLQDITDYIARDNPRRALTFGNELMARCSKLKQAPLAFPARDDLAEGLRMMPYRRYLIFYTVHPGEIIIERILHSARDFDSLFSDAD